MVTIFSIPKPFSGHIEVIQRNAIQSWLQLRPACEVVLFGNEHGIAEVAREFSARHIPEVNRNEYGTPLLNDAFDTAQKISRHPVLCYVNADVIFVSDFTKAVERISRQEQKFLLVGQRWNLDLRETVDFSNPCWEEVIRAEQVRRGQLHPPDGIDYFVFSRGLWGQIPRFAVGRAGWDNWMIYRACSLGVPVIDGTTVLTAIHQTHDYAHHPMGQRGVWEGAEAQRHRALMGNSRYIFTIRDANRILTPYGLQRPRRVTYLLRRLHTLPETRPDLMPIVGIIRLCRAVVAVLVSIASRLKHLGQRVQ